MSYMDRIEYTEENLLSLLAKDREAGAEAAWEMYSGLVWRVCARRLQNTEDVKECVNSTFADFCMRWEQYDPAKGTLRNYICTIADRKAVECYRRNAIRQRAEEKAVREEMETVTEAHRTGRVVSGAWQSGHGESGEDDRVEKLEEALKQLKPLDQQILRMKYYDGMTFKEIAAQMDLPYDMVKKRGERSLKKLWKILILVLVLAALAGCALWLYYHFQFSESAGIRWDIDNPLYEMVGEAPSVEVNGVRITVEDADYQSGTLEVKYVIEAVATFTDQERMNELIAATIGETYVRALEPTGCASLQERTLKMGHVSVVQRIYQWSPEAETEQIPVHLELSDNTNIEETLTAALMGYPLSEPFEMAEQELTFDLKLSQVEIKESDLTDMGTYFPFKGGGFLIREGNSTAGGAIVPFYPFDMDVEYVISSRLTGSMTGYRPEISQPITLVSEDGTEYPMTGIGSSPVGTGDARELYFAGAMPGEYRLRIPYLILNGLNMPEPISCQIPTKVGDSVESDVTLTMVDGSQIHITGLSNMVVTYYEMNVEADGSWIEEVRYHHGLVLDYEVISSRQDPSWIGVQLSVEVSYVNKAGETVTGTYGTVLTQEGDQVVLQLAEVTEYLEPEATLRVINCEYLLDEVYELPITIE